MKFEKGGCWEYPEFEIREDKEISSSGFSGISKKKGMERFEEQCCAHAHSLRVKVDKRPDGSTWDEYVAIVPFVVIEDNEGGHNSTGVCAECVSEGLEKMKKEKVEKAVKEIEQERRKEK